MKQADPHSIAPGTACSIGPCPSISPEKYPHILILSDVAHL